MIKEYASKELESIPLLETSRQFCEWLICDFSGILKYSDRVKISKALSKIESDKQMQFTEDSK